MVAPSEGIFIDFNEAFTLLYLVNSSRWKNLDAVSISLSLVPRVDEDLDIGGIARHHHGRSWQIMAFIFHCV